MGCAECAFAQDPFALKKDSADFLQIRTLKFFFCWKRESISAIFDILGEKNVFVLGQFYTGPGLAVHLANQSFVQYGNVLSSPWLLVIMNEEYCLVVIKFLGRQLSPYRSNKDLRWTNITSPFNFLKNSNLMNSNRDHKFYLPAHGSNRFCSWDLHFKTYDNP